MVSPMASSKFSDQYIKVCPYCGSVSFNEISRAPSKWALDHRNIKYEEMVYVVCTSCHSVVRTYIREASIDDIEKKEKEIKL